MHLAYIRKGGIIMFASARSPITYLISMIRITKSIMYRLPIEVEVKGMARDRVYCVEFSGLGINLIKGFTQHIMQS